MYRQALAIAPDYPNLRERLANSLPGGFNAAERGDVGWSPKLFDTIDLNADGNMDEAEVLARVREAMFSVAMVANAGPSGHEVDMWGHEFVKMDQDHDGLLNAVEMRNSLYAEEGCAGYTLAIYSVRRWHTSRRARDAVAKFDADGDGVLAPTEFKTVRKVELDGDPMLQKSEDESTMTTSAGVPGDDMVKTMRKTDDDLFRRYDNDSSGHLDANEVEKYQIAEERDPVFIDVSHFFEFADTNKDGGVTLEEVKQNANFMAVAKVLAQILDAFTSTRHEELQVEL